VPLHDARGDVRGCPPGRTQRWTGGYVADESATAAGTRHELRPRRCLITKGLPIRRAANQWNALKALHLEMAAIRRVGRRTLRSPARVVGHVADEFLPERCRSVIEAEIAANARLIAHARSVCRRRLIGACRGRCEGRNDPQQRCNTEASYAAYFHASYRS